MKNNTIRESNIELLRIIAILCVIILHLNNKMYHGGFEIAEYKSSLYYFLLFVEALCIFPVDLFFIITGYFMANKKSISIRKPVELLIQVILIKEALVLLDFIKNPDNIQLKKLFLAIIPNNYFVILYISVFLIIPFANKIYENVSKNNIKKIILVLFIIFSIYPTMVDTLGDIKGEDIVGLSSIGMYGSMNGYCFVNFLLCYFIGSAIRLSKIDDNIRKNKVVLIWVISVIAIAVWSFFTEADPDSAAWSYCNPFVIIEATSLFIIFKNTEIGKNKIVNSLSKCVFMVFLAHGVFLKFAINFIFNSNNILLISLKMLVSCIIIFLICYFIHIIYSFIMNPIFDFIEKKIGFYNITIEDNNSK